MWAPAALLTRNVPSTSTSSGSIKVGLFVKEWVSSSTVAVDTAVLSRKRKGAYMLARWLSGLQRPMCLIPLMIFLAVTDEIYTILRHYEANKTSGPPGFLVQESTSAWNLLLKGEKSDR